jgi:hypothetical protein
MVMKLVSTATGTGKVVREGGKVSFPVRWLPYLLT